MSSSEGLELVVSWSPVIEDNQQLTGFIYLLIYEKERLNVQGLTEFRIGVPALT